MKRLTRAFLCALIGVLGAAGNAAADPYVLRPPSSLNLDFEGHGLWFVGDGFTLAHHPMLVGVFFPLIERPNCDPCVVGDVHDASFRTTADGFLGRGPASIGGSTYSDVDFYGTLDLSATPVILPSPSGDVFELETPFVFDGFVRGVAGGEQVFALALTGRGRALRVFDYSAAFDLYFAGENRPSYVFDVVPDGPAPVPEPGTLLLLATGAAIAGGIRRRTTLRRLGI